MSKSREQLNDFLREISINNKVVLDVGVQDKPTRRMTQGEPKSYFTTDIDTKWNPDFAFDLNVKIENLLDHTKQTLLIDDPDPETMFDVIFCIEVLEHCWNPIRAIQNMASWLKPGGVLYIATPFINPHHDEVDFLRYTDEWYETVLPKFGMKVRKIKERKATAGLLNLQMFYAAEGMKYSKVQAKKRGAYTYPVGYFVEAVKPKHERRQ